MKSAQHCDWMTKLLPAEPIPVRSTSGVKLLNLDADDKVADPCTTPAPRLPGSALPIRLLIVLTASNDRSGCARTK
jgi:hypothetical protein